MVLDIKRIFEFISVPPPYSGSSTTQTILEDLFFSFPIPFISE